MKLLITFEQKSLLTGRRVKGISFHHTRPWVLTSLHSGSIELYDYRLKILLHTYNEHEGAVRGICFHPTQPLFCSGGDDFKVKVFNYQLKKCLFTLSGHSDYIRTVEFHNEQPWIVSCSDDHTIRIWNWQSRQCLATIIGHHHYVMCARFHPTDDILVSGSLDQEIRVWDISALKHQSYTKPEFQTISKLNKEIFGSNDVVVKFIMEGHDRGVNWVCFHPTSKYILSGADDKYVRLWRYKDDEGWEVDSFIGHIHNVSCVCVHPEMDMVISNSEDKTIKFWSLSKGTSIGSYEMRDDRFWILGLHPTQNLIAAGHDSGFFVFKLFRERPPNFSTKNNLYYIKDDILRKYCYEDGTEKTLGTTSTSRRDVRIHGIEVREADNGIIISEREENKLSCDFYSFPESSTGSIVKKYYTFGTHCTFIGNNRVCFLEASDKIIVKKLDENKRTRFDPVSAIGYARAIFRATSGRVIIQSDQKVHLFDIESNHFVDSVKFVGVKFVIVSNDKSRIALISKNSLLITTNQLKELCSVRETTKIKSGVFDGNEVFVYTTTNHLKYCLTNGDNSIMKTLHNPIYLTKIDKNNMFYLTRKGLVEKSKIDSTEYKFKLALLKSNHREIQKIIGRSKLLGDSIISYLYQKGYPKIAMKFVKDETMRFNLAVECGDIKTAKQCAFKIDTKDVWEVLAREAIKQGDHLVVEKAYERNKNWDSLSFLYFITGQTENLKKMTKLAEQKKDVMSKFHLSLLTGDTESRIKILIDSGHYNLAYVTAITYGLNEIAEKIKPNLEKDFVLPKNLKKSTLVKPPEPLLLQKNWPLLYTESVEDEEKEYSDDEEGEGEGEVGDVWDGNLIPKKEKVEKEDEGEEETVEWGNLGIDVGDEDLKKVLIEEDDESFIAPTFGIALNDHWKNNSKHPTDLISIGLFSLAMKRLTNYFGILNFKPLKHHFMNIFVSSKAQLQLSFGFPAIETFLERDLPEELDFSKSVPSCITYSLQELNRKFEKEGLRLITKGKFEEAKKAIREILYSLIFAILKRGDYKRFREVIKNCCEYLTGINVELERKSLKNNPKRSIELSCFFTRCKLKPKHIRLTVFQAMGLCYKTQNFITAAGFAERLLSLNPTKNQENQAKFAQKHSRTHATNQYELNYDERNPFVICTVTNTPIYAGSDSIKCAFCKANALPKFKGKICKVCEISSYGGKADEKKFFDSKKKDSDDELF